MVERHDDAVTANDEPCAKHESVDICLGIRLDEVSCESWPPAPRRGPRGMSPPAVTNLSQPPSSGGSVKELSRGESILERYQHSHENFVLVGICCDL